MAELFKNIYNITFYNKLLDSICTAIPSFNKATFIESIFDKDWESRELKQRMRHTSIVLNKHLKGDFPRKVEQVIEIIRQLKRDGKQEKSVEYMFLPDFIEYYGLEDYETSVMAMKEITEFTSCEFAIRPFIIKYKEQMITEMHLWSKHSHPMVRRLSTEGCRPRLPWAIAIPSLKKDPKPILSILETLKNDDSESVRRSVANNLNDISKDNPSVVIKLVKKWQGKTVETDRLIKHACRTLLKQGDQEIMQIFGFGDIEKINILDLKIHNTTVKIGDSLEFNFRLENTSESNAKIRLEYGVYYQKANGSLSRKVYKISEKGYVANSVTEINRKQSFRIITTRKFHKGEHRLSLIINGNELECSSFELIN